jgi:hypothetical protein
MTSPWITAWRERVPKPTDIRKGKPHRVHKGALIGRFCSDRCLVIHVTDMKP